MIDIFEGQTRRIWVNGVLARWYCVCFLFFFGHGIEQSEKKETRVGAVSIHLAERRQKRNWFFHSRQIHGGVSREWGSELGVFTCSLNLKQSFDNVSPENLCLVMKEMDIVLCWLKWSWGNKLVANMTFPSKKQGSLAYRWQVHQTNRKGESVLIELDHEECFYNIAKK